MSRHHQMPKHEIENVFTEELKQNLVMNLASLCYIANEKSLSKNFTKNVV